MWMPIPTLLGTKKKVREGERSRGEAAEDDKVEARLRERERHEVKGLEWMVIHLFRLHGILLGSFSVKEK